MAEHLEGLMSKSMEKIRELVDIDCIVGEQIKIPDGTVIIPISRVSFGFVSGGSDIPTDKPNKIFGGGAGAGVTVKPQAFIVVKRDGDVEMLELGSKESVVIDGLVTGIPELITNLKAAFRGDSGGDDVGGTPKKRRK